ncbi:hypothetical protein P10VF_141 [Rhizobium phage vB_RleM_P10VF]|uniref:Uncharacterized protein n=1 Tax=Rhizobium phage vB_RleM_P10VF TaxID=1527770 RepID=A0A076YNI4_9CAUD|nr:hypothetical protein P10VF_141 [Rhizobium phage vB_RleM_P10VF]AIK68354.1 hypothetical protein P10VF_141 [Rhizobium phage vB_RleM_P10VF]
MATAVFTTDTHEQVAHRFFGGVERGPCVQMEVTRFEWNKWKNTMVVEETSETPERFEDWFNRMVSEGRNVQWDNAARQNEMARNFEQNRFFESCESVQQEAKKCRDRARDCVRQEMRGE